MQTKSYETEGKCPNQTDKLKTQLAAAHNLLVPGVNEGPGGGVTYLLRFWESDNHVQVAGVRHQYIEIMHL